MELQLMEGGGKKLRQSRGYRLGEVDSLVLKHKLKEWARMGAVKNGITGEGPRNISAAFVVPKQGHLLGRMVADCKRNNSLTEKTVWKGGLRNFAHLEGKETV